MAIGIQESMNDRLRLLRDKLQITQKQMAERLSVKQSYYSDLENSRRNISSKLVQKLAEIFFVSSDWLYTGKGSMLLHKSNKMYPENVPQIVPHIKSTGVSETENDLNLILQATRISPVSVVLIDKLIENTIQLISFYCDSILGRISLSESPGLDLKQVKKYMDDLGKYIEDIRPRISFSPADYENYTIDDKILFLNQLNTKLGQCLDVIWELGSSGEWVWR